MSTNRQTISFRVILFGSALLAGTAPAAPAAPDPDLDDLQTYRCPVADRLQRLLNAGDPTKDRDRVIAVTRLEHKLGSVPCLFQESETAVLCEAASGVSDDKPGAARMMRLAPDKMAALGRLGVSTDDSAGNLRLDIAVPTPPDLGRIADLILRALSDGDDARVDKTLPFETPVAPGLTPACDPVG